MDKAALKQQVAAAIDNNANRIIALGREILEHPELGFKEFQTADLVRDEFEKLSLKTKTGIGITGVRGDLPGCGDGPHLAVLGELDSVISRGHSKADVNTGAAHACGHHAQVAGMIGSALGLVLGDAMKHLGGVVTFFGVPAEELIEIEFRQELRRQGKIQYLLGKQQFIAEGELDGVNISMMFHLEAQKENIKVSVGGSHNGALAKFVRYTGKEAHAGAYPHLGINALNAAMIGLLSIHAQRETFQDKDSVRVHPIITRGGDLVNTVPCDVTMEMFVRAKTLEAIEDASQKVNRALKAGGDAVGATCEILAVPGYLPRRSDPLLDGVFEANAKVLVGKDAVDETEHRTGSTDMGDISQLMPALHPYFRAAVGRPHTETFQVVDEELASVTPAKALAWTVIDLLWDGGKAMQPITSGYKRSFTSRTDYIEGWQRLVR